MDHQLPIRNSILNSIRQGTSAKVDGSFVATVLETAAVGVLYLAWKNITEGKLIFTIYPLSYPRLL